MVIGINHTTQFTATVSDQTPTDFPDADGQGVDTGSAMPTRACIDARGQDGVSARVTNDDAAAALTAELQVATEDDPTFDDPVTVATEAAIAAGDSVLLSDVPRQGAFYRVLATYDAAPTAGADNIVVTYMFPSDPR